MDGVLEDFLDSFSRQSVGVLGDLISDFSEQIFYIEKYLSASMGNTLFTDLYRLFYLFFLTFLALKVLSKGFNTYILWRDGDPDTSPREMIISLCISIVAAVSFPLIYDVFAELCIYISDAALLTIVQDRAIDAGNFLDSVLDAAQTFGGGLIGAVMVFVYIVCLILFWFQILQRSVDVFLLRITFPIACGGLIDSDGGVFKVYMKTFLQVGSTVIIQIICFYLSTVLMFNGHPFFAVGAMLSALNGPKLMSGLILVAPGGGLARGMQSSSMVLGNLMRLGRGGF